MHTHTHGTCAHTYILCGTEDSLRCLQFPEHSPSSCFHIPCFCFTGVCLGKGGNWEWLKVETWFTSVHLWASFGSFWEKRGMHLGIQEEVAVSWGISLAQTQSRSWTQAVLQRKKLDRMSPGLSKPRAYSFHAWYPLKMAFCSGRPILCPGQSMSRWWKVFSYSRFLLARKVVQESEAYLAASLTFLHRYRKST